MSDITKILLTALVLSQCIPFWFAIMGQISNGLDWEDFWEGYFEGWLTNLVIAAILSIVFVAAFLIYLINN